MSSSWIRKEKREAIYARDGHACIYCGADHSETLLTLDHVTPRNLGGGNEARNLVTACLSCNSSKQDTPLRDWLVTLRDRGVDTTELPARIRRHVRRKINIEAAKVTIAARG